MNAIECADRADFDARWPRWSVEQPFPLLPGPAVERYRRLLSAQGTHDWPAATGWRADGLVVSVGGATAEAVGHLLGAATGRPHDHVATDVLAQHVRAHAAAPVAVVGLAEDIAASEDWPGAQAPRAGVITARDDASLVCLAYRILTAHVVTSEQDFLVTHPTMEDAAEADAVAFDELDRLRSEPMRLLTLRSHGRECASNLPDGVLCGRSDYLGIPLPLSTGEQRVPSCLRGGGCFRPDLDDDQRLQVAEVDAQLVFAHSCSAVAAGNALFPDLVGLGLGFLSGTAVAVIGAVGRHTAHVSARHEFERALAEGLALGDVVERLNRAGRRLWGELATFGLLGDPALVLRDTKRPAPVVAEVPSDGAALRRLREWNTGTLTRLERLRWLGLDVSGVGRARDRVLDLTRRHHAETDIAVLAEFGRDLVRLQETLLGELVHRVHDNWWQFQNGLMSGLRAESGEPCRCPGCGLERASLVRLRHRVEPDLVLQVVQCRRCGPVVQSTGGTPGLAPARDGFWARREVPVEVSVLAVNPGDEPVDCTVGYAFVAGEYAGLAPPTWTTLSLAAGEVRPVEWTVEVKSAEVRPDEHEIAFLCLSDGVLTTSSGHLCLLGDVK